MTDEPFLTHPIRVDDIPDRGMELTLEVEASDRARLAKAFDLVDIASLGGHLKLKPKGRDVVVTGEVKARITQTCVVTLETFESDVLEPVDVRFSPEAPDLDDEDAALDAPDPIINGVIDVGSLVAEFLALSLDPYPRKPGAEFSYKVEDEDEHPFAALKKLT
jgi:uncharacterized metal-binding protein YceD (DUF177 family)